VIGMTTLALDTEVTEYQRECLETVNSSATSLLTILNDILDFSKIESRRLELEAIPFSLADSVGDVLKRLAVRAHQKGLELICDIQPEVPAGVVGDPGRLSQILTNLVGNAIKFTESGHILVSIGEQERRGDRTILHVQVTDTGIGIPVEQQPRVFEAFKQADGSTTRRFGGTGLGLTISGSLVELMGGRLWLESEVGVGSTFQFTVDLGVSELPVTQPDRRRFLDLPVLVVDDNHVNRQVLSKHCAAWGMRPVAVDGGRAALDALTVASRGGRPFAMMLLDVMMPDMDGFEVAAEVARRPELAGVKILILSSAGLAGETERCHALGVAARLAKPVRVADLIDAIDRALDDHTYPVASAPRPAMPIEAASRRRRVLVAEDNAVNQRVAMGLLSKRGHEVVVVGNGREALDAVTREHFDVVLMDVQMPEMDGFEATMAIRERERLSGTHVHIIAMTAHALADDADRCLRSGMDGYLSKPLDAKLLHAAVETAIDTAATPPAI
jgi:CheY-like chemotaxis protein